MCGGEARGFMHRFELAFFRCAQCRLEFISPQPDDAALARIYGEHYYAAWGLARRQELVYQLKLGTFDLRLDLIAAGLPPRAKVLDLGCATGFFLDAARLRGLDAFGVEWSEFGASTAASRHGFDHVFRGEFADARFAALPHNRFDAIFMSDFIEHVRDPFSTLRLAFERLERGGFVVITTPKIGSLSYKLMGHGWSQYKAEHLYYFSAANMRRALEDAGFADIQYHPAKKRMSLNYIFEIFRAYPHRLLSPVAALANRVLPEQLRNVQFLVSLGDMVAVARKRP